jgi:hypothetical protein
MTRIPWDLEDPTNSSNAVADDSIVGHRHLLIRLADRTAEGRVYVAESAPDFSEKLPPSKTCRRVCAVPQSI